MAKYFYLSKDAGGNSIQGSVEASDEADAKARIRSKNLVPIRIVKAAGGDGIGSKFSLFNKKVSSKDLQIFTRQFSTLINAGIPVVDALKILGDGRKHPIIKSGSARVKQSIEGGRGLAESMAQVPELFDRFYVNMIKAGQEAGILDSILNRLATYLEKTEKLKKQIVAALVYPGLIITVASLVVLGILFFIIPQFQEFYKGMGKELPALTQYVVGTSNFLLQKWYIVVVVLVGGPYLFFTWYSTNDGKDFIDRNLVRVPFLGDLLLKSAMARMTRTLSTLLSSGVGLIEAIEIASKTAGNIVVEEALIRSKEAVIVGKPLAAPLIREKIIPDMVTQMVAIGEQSGTLDVMLAKIADFYEEDVEVAVRAMTSMIEPLLMIVLGGVVAFLMVAMYLPIFNMSNVSGL